MNKQENKTLNIEVSQNKTFISVEFYGLAKRQRREQFQSFELTVLDGHKDLSESVLNELESSARTIINSRGYKVLNNVCIVVRHGAFNGGFKEVLLFPKQKHVFKF